MPCLSKYIKSFRIVSVETAKVLTNNVLEIISSLKEVQDAGRPTNEAFTDLLDDFRNKLGKELERNNSRNTDGIEER